MLNIQIDDPELERSIRQTYGNDNQSIAHAFFQFIHQQRIKQDVSVSIQQFAEGEGTSMEKVFSRIKEKYE